MGKKDKGRSKGRDKSRHKLRKRDRHKEPPLVADDGPDGSAVSAEAPWAPDEPDTRESARRHGTAPGPPDTIEDTELAARLASLGTLLHRQLAWGDSGQGLTRARLSALALLALGGPRTLGELATTERVRPPTMTRLVRAMEADGLVTRERHPEDGRSVVIRATASGERSLAAGRLRQLAPLAAAIADLDRDERRQLEDAVDVLGRLLRDASRATEPAG